MSSSWSNDHGTWIISWSSMVLMLAATHAVKCPEMCNCQQPNTQQLNVDCGTCKMNKSISEQKLIQLLLDKKLTTYKLNRTVLAQLDHLLESDITKSLEQILSYTKLTTCKMNESVLTQELNQLLSDTKLTESLKSLQISNTSLTQVPMSVCQLTNLTSLNLDNNQLTRLPDNCFTGMIALRSLSARRNNITQIQDGLFDGLNNLTELHFDQNQIKDIGLRVFFQRVGFSKSAAYYASF